MADEEFDFISKEERIKALGYEPQRELAINFLLPYSASLDDESKQFFHQIKTNFGKSVMLREMKPGCGVWSSRLMKYLSLYGYKFSKEDHITLIKLLYELITIPNLEPHSLHKFFTLFLFLIKKRYLLSPEELVLPWRPLYDLGINLFDKTHSEMEMFHYPSLKREKEMEEEEDSDTMVKNMVKKYMSGFGFDEMFFGSDNDEISTSLEVSYSSIVKYAKTYFPDSATKEILDITLPKLIPWSNDSQILTQLVMFLPVTLPASKAALGHELWFDKMFDLWKTCHNPNCGVLDLLVIFSSLSKHNPGAVDWEEHVPFMFSRFLHCMHLPVGYKEMQYSKSSLLDVKCIALWIVWNIKPGGSVLSHLRSLLNGVSSYLHSANNGRWTGKLREFIRSLSREFLERVRREREKIFQQSWMNKTPETHKIRECDITEFVTIIFESTTLTLTLRSEISNTLHNLALLRPAIVIPPLLEKLRSSLESLTEPQKLTTALQSVSAVARSMVCGASGGYPEGPTHVVPLLLATLPGIDSNDIRKTAFTLQFISVFTCLVPIVDCSSAPEYYTDLTDEERYTCETTAQFEDFVLLYFDRVFNFIESSIQEHGRPETDQERGRSKIDSVMELAIVNTTTAILYQSSPKIYAEALNKFKRFALSTNFETNVSGNIVGVILKLFSRRDSIMAMAAFVPQLCDELNILLASDDVLVEENPSRELLYRLHLLASVVDNKGVGLLNYVPSIMTVLNRGLKLQAKEAIGKACNLLCFTIKSLSTVNIVDYKSVGKDYGKAPETWLPIREWGKGCKVKDSKFQWHIPDEEAVKCCQLLIDTYLKPEMEQWELWVKGEREMCPKQRLRSLWILSAATRCSNLMPVAHEETITMVKSIVPATSFPLTNSIKYYITLNGENFRGYFAQFLRRIQTKLLKDAADDTRCFDMLVRLWERISGVKNSRAGPDLKSRMRIYSSCQRSLDGRGGKGSHARVRMQLADALLIQEETRSDLQSEAGITKTGMLILTSLFELSVSSYATVRIVAQCRLSWMLSHYAYSYKALVTLLKELFEKGGEGDEWHAKHKGALYISFGPKCAPFITKPDWEVIKTIWPMILNAPLTSEKPSILKLEQYFLETIHRQCTTINTTLTIHDACIDAAKEIIPAEQFDDPTFQELLAKAKAQEELISETNLKHYHELLDSLVNIANTPNIIWRRLELILMTFNYCTSLQTPFTPNVIRLVTDCLIHDDIKLRKISIKLLNTILKQLKVKANSKFVDPYEVAGLPRPDEVQPGYRSDNQWMLWPGRPINTDEDWEKPFLRNINMGFYQWPDTVEVAAPSYEQDSSKRTPEDMGEGERYIYDKLNDDQFVEKWVNYLTAEDKKGKDKFNGMRFYMFRILFRTYGYPILSKFMKHAKLQAAKDHESAHRFVCEIVAAAMRAPKYWNRELTANVYRDIIDCLEIALYKITQETYEDWGSTVASGVDKVDAQRFTQMIDALFAACSPQRDHDPEDNKHVRSFGVCARLYALQGILGALTWRGVNLCNQLLDKLETSNFLQHPYQNVRNVVGDILVSIFDLELSLKDGVFEMAPKYSAFLAKVKPQLAALYDEHGEIVIKSSVSTAPISCATNQAAISPCPVPVSTGETLVAVAKMQRMSPEAVDQDESQTQEPDESENKTIQDITIPEKSYEDDLSEALQLDSYTAESNAKEHIKAINLLITVLRAGTGLLIRGVDPHIKEQYELVRVACALSTRGPPSMHDGLSRSADAFLAALALAEHSESEFDIALTKLEEIVTSKSWWARLSCVDYAQPLFFYGLPYMRQSESRALRVENLTFTLMRDRRLEVRRAAAKILTGLMHCQALANEDATIQKLMRSCRSKDNVERHFGVLGLCGYLCSKPYSVAPKLGTVLAELSRHTSAPDPIPSTIVSALGDFRRTHQDDWPRHREAMTNEELDLLADLTSPPSYCA